MPKGEPHKNKSSNASHRAFQEDQARRNLGDVLAKLVTQSTERGQPGIKNAVIHVEIPKSGFVHATAVGEANAGSDTPMTPDHQFHLASVTKTMTATLLLQLWEKGALGPRGLDATLEELELFDVVVLDRLHVLDGVNYGREITVRQLLTHTAGIKDAVVDDAEGTAEDYGEAAPGSYGGRLGRTVQAHMACLEDPDCDLAGLFTTKDWVPWDPSRPFDQEAGVVNWFLNSGTAANPLYRPGQAYHYSDTGYVILGLLTEKLSGKDLHAQLRERIFDPLGMAHSYLAYAKDPDPAPWEGMVADYYQGDLPGVTAGINLSFDRGGGGVVATAADLNRFLQGLINGELYSKPEVLTEMLRWEVLPGLQEPCVGVGLGIFAERTPFRTLVLGHSGAWGAKMYYEVETGTFLAGTINQSRGVPKTWWIDIFEAMHKAFE